MDELPPKVPISDLPTLSDLAFCMTMLSFAGLYRTKKDRKNFINTWKERAKLQKLDEATVENVVKYFNHVMAEIPSDE